MKNPCDSCKSARFCGRKCYAKKDYLKHISGDSRSARAQRSSANNTPKTEVRTMAKYNANSGSNNISKCRYCGANVVWLTVAKTGRKMPTDAALIPYKENPNGKSLLFDDWGQTIKCDLEFEGLPTGAARMSHWATCPRAQDVRKDYPRGNGAKESK